MSVNCTAYGAERQFLIPKIKNLYKIKFKKAFGVPLRSECWHAMPKNSLKWNLWISKLSKEKKIMIQGYPWRRRLNEIYSWQNLVPFIYKLQKKLNKRLYSKQNRHIWILHFTASIFVDIPVSSPSINCAQRRFKG